MGKKKNVFYEIRERSKKKSDFGAYGEMYPDADVSIFEGKNLFPEISSSAQIYTVMYPGEIRCFFLCLR